MIGRKIGLEISVPKTINIRYNRKRRTIKLEWRRTTFSGIEDFKYLATMLANIITVRLGLN